MHLEKSSQKLITDYGPGSVSVDGERFTSAILVARNGVSTCEMPGSPAELTLEMLQPLIDEKPEILVFGSGRHHKFPPMKLMADLAARGVALEVMKTSAACRTYNVLVSEFRDVCAALLPIEETEEAKETEESDGCGDRLADKGITSSANEKA